MGAFWGLAVLSLWLTSFPMEGFLLLKEEEFFYFLLPHALGLYFFAFLRPSLFLKAAPFGVSALGILTAVYPFFDGREVLVVLLGLLGSAFSLTVAFYLKEAVPLFRPKRAWVLGGLAFGNLGAFLLKNLPLEPSLKYLLLGLAVSSVPYAGRPFSYAPLRERLLPSDFLFLFFFYVCGGLMYGFVFLSYRGAEPFPMVEVLFYAIAVVGASFLLSRGVLSTTLFKALLLLFTGGAFLLAHLGEKLSTYLSVFLLQWAFGFADLYAILLLLKYQNVLKAFGLGLGVLCTAILTGSLLSKAGFSSATLSLLGTLTLLATAVITFAAGKEELLPPSEEDLSRLSPREKEVFTLLREGKSYREISEELGISVSSVREYVRRIKGKLKEESLLK